MAQLRRASHRAPRRCAPPRRRGARCARSSTAAASCTVTSAIAPPAARRVERCRRRREEILGHERHVAARNDDAPAGARLEPLERDVHGVAGAELLAPARRSRRRSGRSTPRSSSLITTRISVDAGGAQRPQHVPKHRASAELVQHLRARALHARAFAGGQNDRARSCTRRLFARQQVERVAQAFAHDVAAEQLHRVVERNRRRAAR